ncbi:FtsX-like permease family protein [Streptomyces maoxianensis]|uniref:FtsX-like permease family protein n=1 Tax=Streptomyces maoxianensis TaxID=1459942 RepID=A0ABV9G7S7_9ACTN
MGGTSPELWINIAVLAVLLGYLLLGIANKLIATTAARRTELATLQLIGATPYQVRAMMRREAILIATLVLITGPLPSVVPLALLSVGSLHRPWPAGPAWLLPAGAGPLRRSPAPDLLGSPAAYSC